MNRLGKKQRAVIHRVEFSLLVLIAGIILCEAAVAQLSKNQPLITYSDSHGFFGKVKDNLCASAVFDRDWSWRIYIQFTSTRSLDDEWWMSVTNRIGCKLRLWQSNGREIYSKNPTVDEAFHLCPHAPMGNLYNEWFVHNNGAPYHLYLTPDAVAGTYAFTLGDLFPINSNREYVVEIRPMLYKVKIDHPHTKPFAEAVKATANLVEFPTMYARLLTNGTVVHINGPPSTP